MYVDGCVDGGAARTGGRFILISIIVVHRTRYIDDIWYTVLKKCGTKVRTVQVYTARNYT